jgi:hypothetical protein
MFGLAADLENYLFNEFVDLLWDASAASLSIDGVD